MVKLDDAARHDAAAGSGAGTQAATPTAGAAAGACGFANPDALSDGVAPVLGNDGGQTSATAGCRSARNVEDGHIETQPSTTECGETASGTTGLGAGASDATSGCRSDRNVEAGHVETQPSTTECGETASGATEPGAGASGATGPGEATSDADASGQSEPGWGVSYGFDHDVELPGDAAIAEQADAEPGWGATGDAGESREVGPFFDALDAADAAVDALQALLADRSVPVADLAAATVRLHTLTCRVQAAHLAALGQTVAANALPEGSPTANAWLGFSHRMDSSRASKARNDAAWLADHAQVAVALAAGLISVDHVTVMRTISQANKIRRAAFADFEPAAIEAATMTDPAGLRQIMNLWATMVDPDSTDDNADNTYERRHLFVTHLGDRWIIKGEVPDDMGARLAGTLNAYMEQLRGSYDTGDGVRISASARRADALDALIATVITQATAAAADNPAAVAADSGSHSADNAADNAPVSDAQLTLDDARDASADTVTNADAGDTNSTGGTDMDNTDDAGSTIGDDTNPATADDAGSTIGDDANPTSTYDTDDNSDDDAAGDPSVGDDPSDPFGPGGSGDPSDPFGPSDPSGPSSPLGPSDPFGLGGSGGSGAVITLPPTALTRAQVVVTVPITALHTCGHCRNDNNPAATLTHILTSHTHHTGSSGNGTSTGTGDCTDCSGCTDDCSTGGCPNADTPAGAAATEPGLGSDARDTIKAALATGATWAVGNGPGTGTLAPALARYASCDGEITRLVVAPASRPLDLGRTRRVVPLSLRRALEIRDRGCIIPGCDRPAGWCHAHHITHWADGGETDLSNLALLCQHHHTELHLGHWHIDMNNGTPHATHIPPHQRARYRRNQRTAQSNRPTTTPRRT